MSEPRISVIIPTIGRETLQRAVDSAADADEVIVVWDTTCGRRARPPLTLRDDIRWSEIDGGDHGYPAREHGMELATGTHLAFLDDDDVYLPGAIAAMRAAAGDRPVIFRMDHPEHGVLWRAPLLQFANVGTPMFLVPNEPDRLGRWRPHAPGLPEPGGDFTFIRECCERMGGPVWNEALVASVRPGDVGGKRNPQGSRPTRPRGAINAPGGHSGPKHGISVSVVTPWRDHPELTEAYWEAMVVARPEEVIIVDNASDPPIQVPFRSYAGHVKVVRADENLGFARASNRGLHEASGDAVLFLNNDIVCNRDDWLERLKIALEPGVIASARIRWDRHGDVDGQAYPYAEGWCLIAYRDELMELGGFDDELQEPAYYSDNILSFRARAAGMTLREVKVGLRHIVGATAGGPDDPDKVAAVQHNYDLYANLVRSTMGVMTA